ncbi:MAG: phytanoyl-CoA dioxygenase family protein [Marinosulfonomonas sp.]
MTHDVTARPVWLSANSGSLDDFKAIVGQNTNPDSVPYARSVAANVPIYHADDIAAMDEAALRSVMAEWVNVFMHGAGIIVVENMIAADVMDRATELFTQMIDDEKAAGAVVSDHFAKPGSNDRVWNALEKHCVADPEGFALYYGNPVLAAVCQAWLGPAYQITAQVNRVNPGGTAQAAHRDYHLGFMSPETIAQYPSHIHTVSPVLTLQGALAHVEMPVEAGPTMYLPFSQQYFEGYLAFERPEFQEYFQDNHVQMALKKGDGVFFNPALMHGAGNNVSSDILRLANLVQVSSAFGRAMETVDRTRMARCLYPELQNLRNAGRLDAAGIDAAIAATAEGYAFPTNLDRDPPPSGHAPVSQAVHMKKALAAGTSPAEFEQLLQDLAQKRLTH